MIRIQKEDFSVEEETKELRSTSKRIGGIVTFLGTARDFFKDKDVNSLEFEEYKGMAEKKLEELRNTALENYDIIEVRILHRVGRINPGEQIVLILVGAEHRAAAFDACRWCIDELKRSVPIWKKEIMEDGEQWVEEHP